MSQIQTSTVTLTRIFLLCINVLHVYTMDVKRQRERFKPDYKVYHNLTSASMTIEHFLEANRGFVRYVEPEKYLSKLGKKQHVLRVTNFENVNLKNSDQVKVLLSFGEHAREFLPVESLFQMLKKLLFSWQTSEDPDVDLNQLDIYIVAIANPDGRQHVETSNNYCWRGTSSGVDLNRNFDWEFGGKGSSKDPSDEEYRGIKPFSEPESQTYRDLTEQVHFDGFLSLHSGIKQIYIPFADSLSQRTGRAPENIKEMLKLAKELSKSTIYKYQYGQAAKLNDYSADGSIFDYMAGRRKIPFCYAIELWGPEKHQGPSCFDLFNPPNNRLDIVVSNLYPLYVKFFKYLLEWKERTLNLKEDKSVDMGNLEWEKYSNKIVSFRKQEGMEESSSLRLLVMCLIVIIVLAAGLYGKLPVWWCGIYRSRRVISLRALSSTLSINLFSIR